MDRGRHKAREDYVTGIKINEMDTESFMYLHFNLKAFRKKICGREDTKISTVEETFIVSIFMKKKFLKL